jgi:cytochrome oxidase Cu insertion factor (SCO1/SenC/PrrC family)
MSRGAVLAVALTAWAQLARAGETAHPEGLRGVDPAELTYTYGVAGFTTEYVPPPPGSYELPVIAAVRDHPVLDGDGRPTSLFALKRDRLAVVAFVYTTCTEATGCPFSLAVLRWLDRDLAADGDLGRRVTLLAVSFDPERDTPARLAVVRRFHAPKGDWQFVTTSGDEELTPLLADFGQPVAKLRFPDGRWSGLFRHVLKVFLLDRQNRVRNVYSVGLLDPKLVLNDLRTLAMRP